MIQKILLPHVGRSITDIYNYIYKINTEYLTNLQRGCCKSWIALRSLLPVGKQYDSAIKYCFYSG